MSKRATAQNAASTPQTEPQAQAIPLTTAERIAVEFLIARENVLQQQQREFMANQANLAKDKAALVLEIERAHGVPDGACARGEWSIQGGNIVKQG